MKTKVRFKRGFTLLEVGAVIFVIGILAAISLVSYQGVMLKVNDAQAKSDMNKIASALALYSYDHKTNGKAYYSGDGYDSDLDFEASDGVVIDVVTGPNGYFIRGFSTKGTVTDIDSAFEKESLAGMCTSLPASSEARGIQGWQQISAGAEFACGIWQDQKIYCWGWNDQGQLGRNSFDSNVNSTPVAVNTTDGVSALYGKTVTSIYTGSMDACAITDESTNNAYCWGYNDYYEIGDNTNTERRVPVAVGGVSCTGSLCGKKVVAMSVGDYHACAVTDESTNNAYCWGQNWDGEIGNNATYTASAIPVPVGGASCTGSLCGKKVTAISSGAYHTCVLTNESSNNVYCWGENGYGNLGYNNTTDQLYPRAVYVTGTPMSGKRIVSIATGYGHTCAIDSNGVAYCWGLNGSGQVGDNTYGTNRTKPVAVYTGGALSGKTLTTVAALNSSYHTCVLSTEVKAYCWGDDSNGGLGNDASYDSMEYPVAVNATGVLSGKTLSSITVGYGNDFTLAIDSEGNAYSWGGDEYGQLGRGASYGTTPVPVVMATP